MGDVSAVLKIRKKTSQDERLGFLSPTPD
jgi:hypothetical protein